MQIYPAIDLKSGECVRLYQGSFDQMTSYDKDPLAVAKNFSQQGAKFLHVVDLDGAKEGQPAHAEIIAQMAQQTELQIQVGGGIRHKAQVAELLNKGVARVVLGSIAISEPREVESWLREFGVEKIVLALDVRMSDEGEPYLAAHGWLSHTAISLWDLLEEYDHTVLKHVLCTDIDCDGTLQGPNIALYQTCRARYPHLSFQASGGIGSLEDLKKLAQIPVAGVIIGKALYEKRFTLAEVLIGL
jgi:phosphoribosylformimino-5-aminoimidazole carboxamide ribotide isomerase